MQYLLNQEEYDEYVKLKRRNSENVVHQLVLQQESMIEQIMNSFHSEYHALRVVEDRKEGFNKVIWAIFDELKAKSI